MSPQTSQVTLNFTAQEYAGRGWDRCAIGVEMDNYWYSAAAHASLVRHLPGADFRDATGLVNWRRAVKSEQALAYMRTAACQMLVKD